MGDVDHPGGIGSRHSEPGLDAVRAKYGEDMVQRIRNWPRLARSYLLADYGVEDDFALGKAVEAEAVAAKNVERARRDRTYALDQAERISWQGMSRDELLVVPSAAQLRRSYGDDDWSARGKALAAGAVDLRATIERVTREVPQLALDEVVVYDEAEAGAKRAAAHRVRVASDLGVTVDEVDADALEVWAEMHGAPV